MRPGSSTREPDKRVRDPASRTGFTPPPLDLLAKPRAKSPGRFPLLLESVGACPSHGSPESGVGVREDGGEALAGVRVGWVMEPRNPRFQGADARGVVDRHWRVVGGTLRR
jgi:hypothetical protein